MAVTPDQVTVHVWQRLIRHDQVHRLRVLVSEAKGVAADADQSFLVGCLAGVEDHIDGMFGVDP